jgi:hypothetical protein
VQNNTGDTLVGAPGAWLLRYIAIHLSLKVHTEKTRVVLFNFSGRITEPDGLYRNPEGGHP